MTGNPPTLNYSKPARSSGLTSGLHIIGAAVCAFTGLAGVGILLLGVYAFGSAAFFDMPAIDRPPLLGEAAVISAIGLVMAGFSVRWFLAAVRAVRRAGTDVAPVASDQIIMR
jgi:hypothetical protein